MNITNAEQDDNSIEGRVLRVEYDVRDIKKSVEGFGGDIEKILTTLQAVQTKKPMSAGWISASTVIIVALVSFGGWILNNNIGRSTDPIIGDISSIKEILKNQNEINGKVWERLNVNDSNIQSNLAQTRERNAHLEEKFCEAETQFRAEDKLRNNNLSTVEFQFALLYARVNPGMPAYPQITYYPEMAQDNNNCLSDDDK